MKLIRWVATALLVLYVWFTPVWLCFESWHLWSIQISSFGIFMFLVSCFDSDAIPVWKQCYDCFYSHLFCRVFMLYFFVYIYAYCCSTRFLCPMIFVSLINCTTGATCEPGTSYRSGARVHHGAFGVGHFVFVFFVVFCRSSFVFLSFLRNWIVCP